MTIRKNSLPPGVSLRTIMQAATNDTGVGFCLECGEEGDGFIEPDAENYHCPTCGQNEVFGAELLILMIVP